MLSPSGLLIFTLFQFLRQLIDQLFHCIVVFREFPFQNPEGIHSGFRKILNLLFQQIMLLLKLLQLLFDLCFHFTLQPFCFLHQVPYPGFERFSFLTKGFAGAPPPRLNFQGVGWEGNPATPQADTSHQKDQQHHGNQQLLH